MQGIRILLDLGLLNERGGRVYCKCEVQAPLQSVLRVPRNDRSRVERSDQRRVCAEWLGREWQYKRDFRRFRGITASTLNRWLKVHSDVEPIDCSPSTWGYRPKWATKEM